MAKKKSRSSRRPPARTAAHGKRARSAQSRGGRRPAAKPARAATNSAKARSLESMVFAHKFVLRACDGFPEDKLCYQNCLSDNHALWTLGHLALTYDWFANLLDSKPSQFGEEYQKLFGSASRPNPDRAAYPALADVRSACDAAWDRLLRAAENTSEADMSKPTLSNSMGFAKDRLTVLDRTAWHDGWHAGQVSTLRRTLGLPSLFS